MRRGIIALLLALALTGGACAEALTPEEIQAQQDRQTVEELFAAVAGTTEEAELPLYKKLSKDERHARYDELSAYRSQTKLWLLAVLTGNDPAAEESATVAQTAAPAETPKPDAAASAAAASDETSGSDAVASAAATPEPVLDPDAVYELFATTPTGQSYVEAMAAQGCMDAASALAFTREAYARWYAQIDAQKMLETNSDYAGWLYCPASVIDYPVVQGDDNSYYLHRLFSGESNKCGTLFIDYRNLPDFQDPNTLIYGHHMRSGSMFKSITFYERQSYYESHPYMLMMLPTRTVLIEVMAGYVTSLDDPCYEIAISDSDDMREYVERAMSKSNFLSDVTVGDADHLVTLSTCAYAFEQARYVLIGKLTTAWEAEPVPMASEQPLP